MKRLPKSVDKELCNAHFATNLLAIIGVLTMPTVLVMPMVVVLLAVTMYRQWRVEPESLREAQWWRHPSWQRISLYGTMLVFTLLLRSACDANLFDISAIYWFFRTDSTQFATAMIALFGAFCAFAIKTRPQIATSKLDKDAHKKMQRWTTRTYFSFLAIFFGAIIGLSLVPQGPGAWFVNWLIASARDANLKGIGEFCNETAYITGTWEHGIVTMVPAAVDSFKVAVQSGFAIVVCALFGTRAKKLATFLTAYCKRLSGRLQGQNFIDVLLQTMREARTTIAIRARRPFLSNVLRSLGWLAACYLFLLFLFGFTGGPLGTTICSWLDSSVAGANTGMMYGATANPHLRVFCAAVVALYGTVPFAITTCIFLPFMRRKQLVLNEEGLIMPDGVLTSKGMRLWTDISHVDLVRGGKQLQIRFHSGGKWKVHLSQLSKPDLEKLLSAIDEHASECVITDLVVSLRAEIRAAGEDGTKGGGALGALNVESFQSTTFVPHQPGSWLPNGECRVVRLLASRPLSCVYLVRMENGSLAVAKQFFLAEDNDQTRALRRCFEREYELLQQINHDCVSKVMEVFHKDESTYLLIEHAAGVDLRSLVTEGGAQSESLVIRWALQLCDIMQHLHDHDPPIVHRDLTPDNVIVGEDGKIRIIDFGAAHQFLEGITGTIIGKQSYIAPEQLKGHAGPCSDVYSFGCMLHYLLTGVEPVALTQCSPMISNAEVSNELDELVRECTDFDETRRPASFAAIKERLLAMNEEAKSIVLTLNALKERVKVK